MARVRRSSGPRRTGAVTQHARRRGHLHAARRPHTARGDTVCQMSTMKTTPTPRRHHFVPQFYLAGLTLSGQCDEELWALSVSDGRRWKGKPDTIAHERDFYRVDEVEGLAPDAVERLLAKAESEIAPVLRTILEQEALPKRDSRDFDLLLNLIAGMAARVPHLRSVLSEFMGSIARHVAQLTVASPHAFEAAVESARKGGADIPEKVDYDTMRKFIEGEHYRVEVNRSWLVGQIFQSIDILLPLLASRQWSLLIVDGDDCDFVTSDNPVAVSWSKPQPPSFFGPALGLRRTDVTFPLSRRLALLGRFEGRATTFRADRRTVATGCHAP